MTAYHGINDKSNYVSLTAAAWVCKRFVNAQ